MMATQAKRRLMMIAALAVTLSLTYWVSQPEQGSDIALSKPEHRHQSDMQPRDINHAQTTNLGASPLVLDWRLLQGRAVSAALADQITSRQGATIDLFKPQSWYVPPPAAKLANLPPPPPIAPVAPFAYLGKMENSPQGTLFFLSANNKVYSVLMGSNIDKSWRLDSEDANGLRLTYLPLSLTQILSKSIKAPAAPIEATPVDSGQNNNQGTS